MTDAVQLSLLSPVARARRSDPLPSHTAAKRAEGGACSAQRLMAASAVLRWPGRTARELAHLIGGDALTVERNFRSLGRRLSELREAGLALNGEVRQCSIAGTEASTWEPT